MNIGLFCAAGMSTSMLVTKMRAAAEAQGVEATIEAYPEGELAMRAAQMDVCLLGPQVGYKLKKDQELAGSTPVAMIPMQCYGMMDGTGALKFALDQIKA